MSRLSISSSFLVYCHPRCSLDGILLNLVKSRRWLDKVKDDIKEKGLSADDVYDRAKRRRMPSNIDLT